MNLKHRIIALATAAAIALPAIAVAKHKMHGGKKHTPMAFFKAKINAGGSIDGKTADITMSDDDTNIVVKVDMGRVNTGMDLRNKHFQEKLLKSKKASAVLTVKKAAVTGKKGEASGTLAMNGVTKDVKVKYEKFTGEDKEDGDLVRVTGSTNIKYTEFGFEKMCYLGVCVDDPVEVSAELFVKDEK